MKKAVFFGVSTGPGDPEHMTLKAVRAIEGCDVIAAPRTHKGNSLAFDIVRSIVDLKDKEILNLDFAMSRNADENSRMHDISVRKIEDCLEMGKSVAMLSIGDISLYSTFSYIYDRLRNKYKCEIIPGVNSFSACAAKAGVSLTEMNKPLTIVPGGYENIEAALSSEGTKVIMKSGRGIYSAVQKLRDRDYVIVQNCGLENEIISVNGGSEISDSYFTTILVKG